LGLLILDNQFLGIANALIQEAKDEICIATFKLEINDRPRGRRLTEFFDKLIERIKQGIKVRVLFNWHEDRRSVAKTNEYACRTLKNAGADVRYLQANRCCHAKIILIDKQKAVIGSHNLSVRSVDNNFEISYLVPDPESINQLSSIFDKSFYDAKKF